MPCDWELLEAVLSDSSYAKSDQIQRNDKESQLISLPLPEYEMTNDRDAGHQFSAFLSRLRRERWCLITCIPG